jgi:hypothetical protein
LPVAIIIPFSFLLPFSFFPTPKFGLKAKHSSPQYG